MRKHQLCPVQTPKLVRGISVHEHTLEIGGPTFAPGAKVSSLAPHEIRIQPVPTSRGRAPQLVAHSDHSKVS